MRIYNAGDIVNIEFPNQEDFRKSTYHPAIIIEDLDDKIFVVFMTSVLSQKPNYPNSFVINKSSKEGMEMGLTYDSLICPTRNAVLSKFRVYPPPRGKCPDELIDELLELVKEQR